MVFALLYATISKTCLIQESLHLCLKINLYSDTVDIDYLHSEDTETSVFN